MLTIIPWYYKALAGLCILAALTGGYFTWRTNERNIGRAEVQVKLDAFIADVKAKGDAAEKEVKEKEIVDKRIKENIDHEYKVTLAGLRADNKRLRKIRAGSRIVPSAPTGSRNPKLACFDRADLERTLQRFDEGVSGLFDEGDTNTIGLNMAREWALLVKK